MASNAARRIRTASVTSWPSFVPHPERYIIQRKFGFTQLMRERLKSPPKNPCSAAKRPIEGR